MSLSAAAAPGTRAVSERHRFDLSALTRWLEARIPGFSGPAQVLQFSGGQSNPTFLIEASGAQYVLRKKPPGKLIGSAHAIDREYRVLSALQGSAVPVPGLHCYCDDESIIGTPFYVMEYLAGRIFTDPLLPGLDAAQRAAIYDAMNDALARLHTVDWRGLGLGDFGKPEQFIARQLALWTRQYESARTETVNAMDQLRCWLAENIPSDDQACIAHGDYRLGNLIFHPTEPRLLALLDWELSTIGHPMSDLAFNCMSYYLPAGHPISSGLVSADLQALGIPGEQAYLDAYARRSGRDPMKHWSFYMAFSLYRTAAIQHGVYARSLAGNASSSTAHLFNESYQLVADAGLRLID